MNREPQQEGVSQPPDQTRTWVGTLGGVPEEILYDRMKTVWVEIDQRGEVVWKLPDVPGYRAAVDLCVVAISRQPTASAVSAVKLEEPKLRERHKRQFRISLRNQPAWEGQQ